MRKIGIDKRDPSYRHFYYDDEVILSSNPPKYKINYVDDENDIDYVDCKYVIKIKDMPVVKQPNTETETVVEKIDSSVENGSLSVSYNSDYDNSITVTNQTTDYETKQMVENEPVIKKSKKKSKNVVENNVQCEENRHIGDIKFEYRVFEYDFDNIDELNNKLNEYGEDGWDLVSMEIYKSGFVNKKRVLCVMKKKSWK